MQLLNSMSYIFKNRQAASSNLLSKQSCSKGLIATLLLSTMHFSVNAATCTYSIIEEWDSGYKTDIQINNTDDSPIQEWVVSWQQNNAHSIDNAWNAEVQCANGDCSATPPSWYSQIGQGESFNFGFVASKNGTNSDDTISVNGAICGEQVSNDTQALWTLSPSSTIQFVTVKKTHVAEVGKFATQSSDSTALQGSINSNGRAVVAIDLSTVDTNIALRNERMRNFLFSIDSLPSAYISVELDTDELADMAIGSALQKTLEAELALHAVKQSVQTEVLIIKTSAENIQVSSVKPIRIDSKGFDLDYGIEVLRGLANLTSIGETVPVYFSFDFVAAPAQQPPTETLPADVNTPENLIASYNTMSTQGELVWQDTSDNESAFVVRRKAIDGPWITSSIVDENIATFTESLPSEGEYDYKIIALNESYPSFPSNVARVTVTEGNQLTRGQEIYETQCAGCHGVNGEGIGAFPAINLERNVEAMIDYIRDFMPQASPASCDQQCAEDVATYIQTLWVSELTCNINDTPVSYGARQLKLLTKSEYQNSVQDLVGIDFEVQNNLSEDSKLGFFTNNTHSAMSASRYSNFLSVAEEIADWSSENSYAPALSCSAINNDCVDQLVDELAPKIFRRALTEEERNLYFEIANGDYTDGDIVEGMKLALEGMLSSPQFLYRHELGESNASNSGIDSDAFELTSYEMATFLAYTYTGSTPDDTLLAAAARDELRDEATIIAQAERLIIESEEKMSDFVGSWLGTKDLALANKDENIWPGFSMLVDSMQQELDKTFSYVMLTPEENFSSLYTGGFTFLNQELADHYGISGSFGDSLEKVDTEDRGGILANGAFMARWGEAVESAPVIRSVRVRRRMLCQDQPDPPAGTFAAREQKLAELSEVLQDPSTTNRTKYHLLTEDAPCTNCHTQHINPLGFGMEDFDSVGRVRSNDLNGNLIDSMGELFAPDRYSNIEESIPFVGTQGLGEVLATLPSAQACLPKQMFRYVIGVGHSEIDTSNPEGTQLAEMEKAGYACSIDKLTDALLNDSPRAMFEQFGTLDAVRYRKAWERETNVSN